MSADSWSVCPECVGKASNNKTDGHEYSVLNRPA